MKRLYSIVIFSSLTLILFYSVNSYAYNNDTNIHLRNLRAFAKLYGYIKFFHPSDEACTINWNKFTVYGVVKVKDAKDDEELKNILKELFLPIAPTAQIYSSKEKPKDVNTFLPKDTSGLNVVAWQHFGVGLSDKAYYYKSIRVFGNAKLEKQSAILKTNTYFESSPQTEKLFNRLPRIAEVYETKIDSELICKIPLTIYYDSSGTLGYNEAYPFLPFLKKVNAFRVPDQSADNEIIRLTDVIVVWNIFQHFYPYFDVVKIDWDKVLSETLTEALQNKTADEFYDTLRKMVAKLQDGHGIVYYKPNKTLGGLPIRVEYIENQLVITASEDSSFEKGDIIKIIDGKSGIEELIEEEKYVSGSPQLKRYRALNQFGGGPSGSIAKIQLIRDNEIISVEKKREDEKRDLFKNPILEFDYPNIKRLEKNIYYVNLQMIEEKNFLDSLQNLANADGIIFDGRAVGKIRKNNTGFQDHKIISYLTESTVQTMWWNIPNIVYPDREQIGFTTDSWFIQPLRPHFKGKVIFISTPKDVSYGETVLTIIENYKLADIIGQQTAGTNGNVNYIPLLGGFEIMWTGMKVLKHDGSQHHLIGVIPTYPVQRTIKAVKEGRDEYLEKAIEVINNSYK